jgi:hypothetical protein
MHRLLDPRLILHGLLDLRIVGVIEKTLLNRKFELMDLNIFLALPLCLLGIFWDFQQLHGIFDYHYKKMGGPLRLSISIAILLFP